MPSPSSVLCPVISPGPDIVRDLVICSRPGLRICPGSRINLGPRIGPGFKTDAVTETFLLLLCFNIVYDHKLCVAIALLILCSASFLKMLL